MTGLPVAASVAAWLADSLGDLAAALLWVSMEGVLWVGLVLLLVRALPALPARLRCALWWAVSLKLIAGLVLTLTWPTPLELAVLPPASDRPAAMGTPADGFAAPAGTPYPTPAVTPGAIQAEGSASSPRVVTSGPLDAGAGSSLTGVALRPDVAMLPGVAMIAGAAWLLGLLTLALASLRRHRRRRARRELAPVTDPRTLALLRRLAHRFGVRPPPLATSPRVGTPQLVGWLRPRLLLPAALIGDGRGSSGRRGDSTSDLELALAHELAHLRRRDLLWGVVPWAARLAFFFHPLAAFALREYLLAREAACDAEVLETLDASPRAYGRLLLAWGTVRPGENAAVAATLGHPRQLKRRLTMLQTATRKAGHHRFLTRYLPLAAVLVVLLALVPIRLVAAPDSDTAAGIAADTANTPVQTAQAATAVASAPDVNVVASAPVTTAVATAPAVRTTATVVTGSATSVGQGVAVAPAGSSTRVVVDEDSDEGSYAYSWSHDDGEPMIYLQGENRSVGISTSGGQWDRVRKLQRGDEPLLWFARDGQEYVIRDPALLAEVESAYRPVMEMGKKQGELGADQGELGAKQGELGARQGRLGAEQGELAGKQAVLAAELARIAADRAARELDGDGLSDAERQRLEERTREVRDEMEALRRSIGALGDRQRALGEEQRELGDRQRALGERQRELGERQREASDKARQVVNDVLDSALDTGKAEPVG